MKKIKFKKIIPLGVFSMGLISLLSLNISTNNKFENYNEFYSTETIPLTVEKTYETGNANNEHMYAEFYINYNQKEMEEKTTLNIKGTFQQEMGFVFWGIPDWKYENFMFDISFNIQHIDWNIAFTTLDTVGGTYFNVLPYWVYEQSISGSSKPIEQTPISYSWEIQNDPSLDRLKFIINVNHTPFYTMGTHYSGIQNFNVQANINNSMGTTFELLSLTSNEDSIFMEYNLIDQGIQLSDVYVEVFNVTTNEKNNVFLGEGNNKTISLNSSTVSNVSFNLGDEFKILVYENQKENILIEKTIFTVNNALNINDIKTIEDSIVLNYSFLPNTLNNLSAELKLINIWQQETSDVIKLTPGVKNHDIVLDSSNINIPLNHSDTYSIEINLFEEHNNIYTYTSPNIILLAPPLDPAEPLPPTGPALPPPLDPVEPLPGYPADNIVDPLVNLNANYDDVNNPTSLTIMPYFFEQNSADGIELSVSIYDTKDNVLFETNMISEQEKISLYIPEGVIISHIDASYIWYIEENTSQKSTYLNNELMKQNQISFVSKEIKTFNEIIGNAKSNVNLGNTTLNENLFELILIGLLGIFGVIITLGFIFFLYVILKNKKPIKN